MPHHTARHAPVLLLALSLAACVHARDTALPLRRVVMYRNGVGYFERHGRAVDHHLDFRVRESDVGDFLATLTVTDRDGAAVRAAAFPNASAGARETDQRLVSLAVDGAARDVSVGYTVEAPIWRPSYRLVFDAHGEATMQVWGIVQNQSGEDWNNVRLSLVAGTPVAFRANLATPISAPRPTVTDTGEVIQGVPRAGTALAQDGPDRDGDAILDVDDVCPDSPEDRDGLADTDGCPDPDNDHDRIPDVNDRCPSEPETYNGHDDDDGCPDRGMVLIEESRIEILESIAFDRGSDRVRPATQPIIAAIASTLAGNPQITQIAIEGHAVSGERSHNHASSDMLALARANALLDALVARGVDRRRLTMRSVVDAAETPGGHSVSFRVLATTDGPVSRTPTAVAAHTSPAPVPMPPVPRPARNVTALAAIASMGAATRYDLASPVTIPSGSASMVLLASIRVPDDRLFLFAPDANVAPSSLHPFQIARVRNRTGGLLEPGPMALFDTGSFLGQGLLESLPPDATATIPFALERGIVVEQSSTRGIEGARLVRIHHDAVTITRDHVERTSYTVRNGIDHPIHLLVRHALAGGVALADPPQGTEQTNDAALVPMTIAAHSHAAEEVATRVPFTVETRWDDDLAAEAVESFLRDAHPEAADADRLRAALTLRRQMRVLASERGSLEARRVDLERAADDVRTNLLTIERNRSAGELRVQLVARLARTASDVDRIMRRAVEIDAEMGELRVRFAETVRELEVDAAARTN